ncbi:hypothetical protein WS87_04570 [Burkholderia sp. MSMB0856]|nr:hypothetical protein WS87_04570 [Burkholderia sp. MSMB0856]KVH31080.1 hypothetical protein WS87_25450 [Burkholderia sp. MSMB0856]
MAGIPADACIVQNAGIRSASRILREKIADIELRMEPLRIRTAMPRHGEIRSCGAGAAGWPGPSTGPASRCPAARASCARARNGE